MVMSYLICAPAERFPHEAHLQGAGTLGGEVALVEQYAVSLAPLTWPYISVFYLRQGGPQLPT